MLRITQYTGYIDALIYLSLGRRQPLFVSVALFDKTPTQDKAVLCNSGNYVATQRAYY